MLACAAFGPSFIPKAQKELDAVVGPDRMPTFEDFEELPFIRAIVNETLRWRPVAVLGGTPHKATEDLLYQGMLIPKGSTIIANLWGIHLNPVDFPDPHIFDPERCAFLISVSSLGTWLLTKLSRARFMSKRNYPGPWQHSVSCVSLRVPVDAYCHPQSFGYGRRVCPGQYLASNSIYIKCAALHHLFSRQLILISHQHRPHPLGLQPQQGAR